jgi:DnaK suppressor protein
MMAEAKSPIDESEARELLKRERERIESRLADASRVRESEKAEVETASAPEDDAEAIEDELIDDAVVRQLRNQLEAIERAEGRLEDGTYGVSVESGDPIPAERLRTIPWAERTAAEQERHDAVHGGLG